MSTVVHMRESANRWGALGHGVGGLPRVPWGVGSVVCILGLGWAWVAHCAARWQRLRGGGFVFSRGCHGHEIGRLNGGFGATDLWMLMLTGPNPEATRPRP